MNLAGTRKLADATGLGVLGRLTGMPDREVGRLRNHQ